MRLVPVVACGRVFFGGFADECKVVDSRVPMPDVPGIGFEATNAPYEVMKGMVEVKPG